LHHYKPPKWASKLKNIPRYYVKLAQHDTPTHQWNLPTLPKEFSLFIKRDDMTGSTLSGNKVCKLEFLLADAVWIRSVTQYLHVLESSPIIAEALQLLRDNLVWIVTCS
ncbi:unnamed protein product, partial [Pocillopora meandrina]